MRQEIALSFISSRGHQCCTGLRRRISVSFEPPSPEKPTSSSFYMNDKVAADEIAVSASDSSTLSDVDSRVLQSLLQDPQFLDSIMKENIQELLDDPRKAQQTQLPKNKNAQGNFQASSEYTYTSTFFKSMEQLDTSQLWNSLKAKADEMMESFQILLANRVERDFTLLTSLGVFAWQRIVKDVARALPASGRSSANMAKKMRDALFQLSANSSFVPYAPKDNFILPPSKYSNTMPIDDQELQEWNSPLEEIQSVTAAIRDILSGKTVLTLDEFQFAQDRNLKSVAPPGYAMNSERQRRAYQRRQKTLKRQRENIDAAVGRMVGSVLSDTVWELSKEFQAEGNEPGYQLDTFVKKLQKATEYSDQVIKLQDVKIIKPTYFLDELVPETENEHDKQDEIERPADIRLSLSTLQKERLRFVTGIQLCLDQPQNTWLVPQVILNRDFGSEPIKEELSEMALRNVISTMILTRDNVESDILDCENETDSSYTEQRRIEEFQKLKQMIDSIVSLAAIAAGMNAAQQLKEELVDEDCSILLLDSILESREDEKRRVQVEAARQLDSLIQDLPNFETRGTRPTVMDAVIDSWHQREDDDLAPDVKESRDDFTFMPDNVQVISDDDFMKSLKLKATVNIPASSDVQNKKVNPAILVILRFFDVLFFLVEKTLTTGLPGLLQLSDRVMVAIENAESQGMGKKGWKMLKNLKGQSSKN